MSSHNPHIFNRRLVAAHRTRAAAGFAEFSFIKQEACARLAERLEDIKRDFPQALDLGCHHGEMARAMPPEKVGAWVMTDLSPAMLCHAGGGLRVAADAEFMPFAPESFDLVVSVCALHWVNDVPGMLAQIRRMLKPGGMMMLTLPGVMTLHELRHAFLTANLDTGASPRVSPFIDAQTGAGLLQRAGFSDPVADSDMLVVDYRDLFALLRDLRGMGETAAFERGGNALTRDDIACVAATYGQQDANADGTLRATYEMVTLTGWRNA